MSIKALSSISIPFSFHPDAGGDGSTSFVSIAHEGTTREGCGKGGREKEGVGRGKL